MIDQPILFHKPNKKVRSEKKIDHYITITKHTISVQTSDGYIWVPSHRPEIKHGVQKSDRSAQASKNTFF
jgi:hypothetical protein